MLPPVSTGSSKKEQDPPAELAYVQVSDLRPEGDGDTCLRPLGLCELGGCCDVCWYRPDHPRFKKGAPES